MTEKTNDARIKYVPGIIIVHLNGVEYGFPTVIFEDENMEERHAARQIAKQFYEENVK